MENIYQTTLESVKADIVKAADEQLQSELYKAQLEEKYHIDAPYLDKEWLTVEIKSKTLTDNNAPEGFDYYKGDVVNYAYYSIPVKGKSELLEYKLSNLLDASNKYAIVQGFLFIEEYYFEKIEDNDKAIAAVKAELLKDVAFIERYITEVQQEIEIFQKSLDEEIDKEIAAELDRREIRRKSLDKLNPYINHQ